MERNNLPRAERSRAIASLEEIIATAHSIKAALEADEVRTASILVNQDKFDKVPELGVDVTEGGSLWDAVSTLGGETAIVQAVLFGDEGGPLG